MSSEPERLPLAERFVRRERAVIGASIALLAALAWGWTLNGAGLRDMPMDGMPAMPEHASAGDVLALLTMWWIMMVAMMLPSAAPTILLFGRVRLARDQTADIGSSWVFLAGYLLSWLGVSFVATIVQLLATGMGLVDGMTMRATSPFLAGAALIATGLYQLSPVKDSCLVHCRSPAVFLSRHWRPGTAGALRLGLLHGGYCIGCCWLLMALLFIGGVMNFVWIAALTALVAAEKLSASGRLLSRAAGILLIFWGMTRFL